MSINSESIETVPPSEAKASREKREVISDGLQIALITAGAYLGAYVFEYAYLSVFGVPPEFIEITLPSLIAVGGSLLILSVVAAQLLHLIWNLDGAGAFKPTNGLGLFLKKWGILVVVSCFAMWVWRPDWIAWINAALWGFLMLLDLAIPLMRSKGEAANYNRRLAEWLNRDDSGKREHEIFKGTFAVSFLNTLILIAAFSISCSLLGTFVAKTRSSFGFLDGEQGGAVVRRYGDRFLIVKYDPSKNEFVREFRLIPIDQAGRSIVWRKLPTMYVVVEEGRAVAPR